MEPGCIGNSNTNNLQSPTDLTENPYGKKNFFLKMQLKNRLAWYGAKLEQNPYHASRFLKNVLIFEKKGGC
jgi:hypothetical protein